MQPNIDQSCPIELIRPKYELFGSGRDYFLRTSNSDVTLGGNHAPVTKPFKREI